MRLVLPPASFLAWEEPLDSIWLRSSLKQTKGFRCAERTETVIPIRMKETPLRRSKAYFVTAIFCSLAFLSPARSLEAEPNDDSATRVPEKKECAPSTNASLPCEASPEPQAPQKGRTGSREGGQLGVGIRLSTLGPGAEAAVSVMRHLNVRGGVNFFQYDRNFNHDGVTYKGQLQLRSGEVHVDFYPFGHAFHISPGLLVYNGNALTGNANVPGGSTFTLGSTTYTSDPTNPIAGKGKLDFRKAAPTALIGFGNLVPRSKHFSLNSEVGVVFQGAARTALNLTGNACDPAGLNCVNAATDPTVQANVAAEQTKINNKLSPFKYYPVISAGFGYRF